MRRGWRLGRVVAAVLIAYGVGAQGETTTSGTVVQSDTGAPVGWGWVGLINRQTLSLYAEGQQVWFNQLSELDAAGRFSFTIDDSDPSYGEFFLFTLSPLHLNEISGGVRSTLAFPPRSDFSRSGVVSLKGQQQNTGLVFELDSNRSTHRVLMRDGVTGLATDVYLASPTAASPTILSRTPYNKEGMWSSAWYCLWGYNVAVQDSRGRFASDGVDAIFRADGWGANQDGYDTIDWIVHQPFANDRVGMTGGSALGITQYLCAGALHPALKCCYAVVGTGYNYGDMFFTGGVFRKSMVEGWLAGQGSSFFVDELVQHPDQDSWWDTVDITDRAPLIAVPFLHVGGWFDIFQAGATRCFRDLAAGGSPQKMVIGPWTHGGLYGRTQGELTFPTNAADRDDNFDNDLRFFEYWLKGVDNGYETSPRVRYYVMGDVDDPSAPGNSWRTADSWPPDSTETAYWLTPAGELTTRPLGAGAVDVRDAGSVSYRFDPSRPAPTRGGNNLLIPAGPHDQRPVEARDDVVVFSTPQLGAPLEVTGDVRARLFVSSDRSDTDFMVKLCDVYPDGRSMLITEGALHARHRQGHASEHLLVPGRLYWMDVDMWGTSIVLNAGHRIRVSITSSSDPRWEVNPNTGEPFRQQTHSEIATNRVYCAPGFWSRVVLPVVE